MKEELFQKYLDIICDTINDTETGIVNLKEIQRRVKIKYNSPEDILLSLLAKYQAQNIINIFPLGNQIYIELNKKN